MENNYNFSYAEDEIFDEGNLNIVGDEEEEIVAIVPMGPILGSESEGLKATEYPLITSSIDLSVGTHFSS
ncbi:14360_t:CDS:2 [Rhizophagus irregularis]|nr:14360_t:CDS:2 [Rhizophagus irregularis]